MPNGNTLPINYDNTINTQQGDFNSETSMVTKFKNCIPLFQRYGKWIFNNYPSHMHCVHAIGKVMSLANIKGTVINQADYQEAGRTKTTMNDGIEFTFPMTFTGNDRLNLMGMLGIDPYERGSSIQKSNTFTAIKKKDYGVQGNLIMYYANENQNLVTCSVIRECGIRVLEVVGAGDGLTFEVELYSSQESTDVSLGQVIVSEKFYEDGILFTAGNSPDGILTDFQVGYGVANGTTGDGSLSLAQQATLAANKMKLVSVNQDLDVTDPYHFFLEIRLNGRLVSPSELSGYSEATGLVSFITAPAAETVLEWTYVLNTGFPDWEADREYGVNECVEYGGKVWFSVTPVIGTAPVAAAWTDLGVTSFWDRLPYMYGDISNPKILGNRTNAFVRVDNLVKG